MRLQSILCGSLLEGTPLCRARMCSLDQGSGAHSAVWQAGAPRLTFPWDAGLPVAQALGGPDLRIGQTIRRASCKPLSSETRLLPSQAL
jgi:hypothetical protein